MGAVKLIRLTLWSIPILAVLVLAWGQVALQPVQAEGDAQMALSMSGSGVSCSGGECSVPLGGTFTLAVDIVEAPVQGYSLIQAFIDYGTDLTYTPSESPADEVVWPDIGGDEITLRGQTGPGLLNVGGLTGLLPPMPTSTYVGTAYEFQMACSDSFSQTNVQLLPSGDPVARTDGALFVYIENNFDNQVIPKVDSVTVICGEAPAAEPTALPPTGNGGGFDTAGGGTNVGLWAIIGGLVAAGAAGLAVFGWRSARARRVQ